MRRPGDSRWETHTDTLHRYAADLYAVPRVEVKQATQDLVRQHLGSHGPATRRDVARWMGVRLADVDAAIARLGDELARLRGPEDVTYLDLPEPPRGGSADPGLRLLPEFDGLLLGYEGAEHSRFAAAEHLDRLFGTAAGNALMHPIVLYDGQIVAQWKLLTRGRHRDLEVLMLAGRARLADDLFAAPVGSVETALGIEVRDLRVRAGE